MASVPINSWQIDGETMETVTDFIFLGSKHWVVTATTKLKDTCSLEEKLRPTWTAYKKQRGYLPTKVCIVKALVLPVFMDHCESWTIKIAEMESGSVVLDSI